MVTPGATTATLQGTRNSTGACVYGGKNKVRRGGKSVQQVETAVNPRTCQMTLTTATVDNPGGASPAVHGAVTPQASLPPGSDSYAFQKIAEIDPVGITIVSLQSAILWGYTGNRAVNPYAGTVTGAYGNVQPYMFQYDGWTTYGGYNNPPPVFYGIEQPSGNTGYAEVTDSETFDNTDFENIVIATLGVSGLAACGFTDATATFQETATSYGDYLGDFEGVWNACLSGGCSNLVQNVPTDGSEVLH